ncbi:hypothetical protein KM043_017169 [Ampulex compressa]|nr:hypothetical protein KM043_017169 [Ampulex compressa]
MSDELCKVIPKPPSDCTNETIWLLQPNLFDLKQARERFLQFEEATHIKTSSKNSYAIKTFESCYQESEDTTYNMGCSEKYFSNHVTNKGSKVDMQNDHFFINATNATNSVDQIQPVKKQCKLKRPVPVSKLKPGKVILIDLTKENEPAIRENKKIKRKTKNRLEWLKFVRKKSKVQKSANNTLTCINQVEIADAHSTENSEGIAPATFVDHLPISDDKVSESTESSAVLNLSPTDAYCISAKSMQDISKRNSKCTMTNKYCNLCSSSQKQDDMQYNGVLCLMKLLNIVGQNINNPKMMLNLLKELRGGNLVSTLNSLINTNVVNISNSETTQDKEEVFSQEKSSTDVICSSKECQNSAVNLQAIKQELPSSTDCNMLSNMDGYCNTTEASNIKYINDHNRQAVDVVKHRIPCIKNKCIDCCGANEVKSVSYNNNSTCNIIKSENVIQISRDGTVVDKNSCDKSIISVLSDLDKCMDVLNRIGEHIMLIRTEKQRAECSKKKPDVCAVSTTVSGDQTARSSLGCWLKDIDSSLSDTICRLLELYENKQHLCACNLKELYETNLKEIAAISEEVQCNVRNCMQEIVVSTSKSERCHLDNNSVCQSLLSENESHSSNLDYNKSESINQCDHKSDRISPITEQPQIKNEHRISVPNDQIHSSQTYMMDMLLTGNNDIPNSEITSELELKSFSQTEKEDMMKTDCINEFEDINILDSILNGDMTIQDEQDILEDSQSVLMSQIDCNTSNSILNNITDFFTQSEDSLDDKKEDMLYTASSFGDLLKPLPEGSLGTTGILNSLLDFDLTSTGLPPNDFMYSHVQTVDPHLIKKSVGEEMFSPAISESVPEQLFEKMSSSPQIDIMVDNHQRENNLFNNQTPIIDSSADMIKMEINTNEQGVLQFSIPGQTESPKIQRNVTSLSSDSNELREFKYPADPSYKFNTNNLIDSAYMHPKADTTKQLQTAATSATCSASKVYISKEISSSDLMKSANQNKNSPSSTYSCVSTIPIHYDVNYAPLKLVDTSHLSSTDSLLYNINVISKSDISQRKRLGAHVALESPESKPFYEKLEMRSNDAHNRMLEYTAEINAQSELSRSELQDIKRDAEKYHEEQAKSIERNEGAVISKHSPTTINSVKHQNIKDLSQLPVIPVCASNQRTLCSSKNTCKQVKNTHLQRVKSGTGQNRQLLCNLRTKCKSKVSSKGDLEYKDVKCSAKDDLLDDSSMQYKLNSTGKKLCVENKVGWKFTRTNVKVETEVPKMNLTSDANAMQVSDKSLVKQAGKLLERNADVESRKLVEDTIVVTNNASLEETPMKKRRTSGSLLETDKIVCSPEYQEIRKTRFISMKTDYVCTSRRRNAVGK